MKITPKKAEVALDKALDCLDRAWAADMRGMRYGDSVTGARHRETGNNWMVKSEKHTEIVRAFIRQQQEPKP